MGPTLHNRIIISTMQNVPPHPLSNSQVGSPVDAEFRSCITGIFSGLRALNVMSATGRGLEMEPARRVVQHAWRCRERLFTTEECRELENWRDQNRHFRALIEDRPPPKAAAPAPAPLEKKAKSRKDKVPGSNGAVGGPLPGTKDKGKGEGEGPGRVHKDRLSITELRVEKTARDESEKLQLSSSQKERALEGRNVIIDELLRYALWLNFTKYYVKCVWGRERVGKSTQ